MSLTINDIKEYIKNNWDETSFIEYFNITIDDLVDLFEDFLIDDYDQLAEEIQQEQQIFDGSKED